MRGCLLRYVRHSLTPHPSLGSLTLTLVPPSPKGEGKIKTAIADLPTAARRRAVFVLKKAKRIRIFETKRACRPFRGKPVFCFYSLLSFTVYAFIPCSLLSFSLAFPLVYRFLSSITDRSERNLIVTAPELEISSILIWVYGLSPRSTMARVSSVVTASTPHPNETS